MSDYYEQYVRVYMEPLSLATDGAEAPDRVAVSAAHRAPSVDAVLTGADVAMEPPWSSTDTAILTAIAQRHGPYRFFVTLGTRAMPGLRQQAQVGCFAIHGTNKRTLEARYRSGARTSAELGLDTRQTWGLFYDPHLVSADDKSIIDTYARTVGARCLTRDAFISDVFYRWVYQFRGLCIGHDLPDQLGSLCTSWGVLQRGRDRNSLWMTLCACGKKTCSKHPRIHAKHVGMHKDMLFFGNTEDNESGAHSSWFNKGSFLNTITMGQALHGTGATGLREMGEQFKADVLKTAGDLAPSGPITVTHLDDLVNTVDATWALFRAERDLYRAYGIARPMHHVFSPAGIAKGITHDLGLPGVIAPNPRVAAEVQGYGMVASYGGRVDVGSRLTPREVVPCDFHSQYSAAHALLGLNDLTIAAQVDIRPCADAVRAFLVAIAQPEGLALLQQPETWRRMRCLVKIKPRGDLLPFRADYGNDDQPSVGLQFVEQGEPIWYALPDLVYSVIQTGWLPDVLDALELVPVGRVPTRRWALFGDERYTIDPARQDPCVALIDLRAAMKRRVERAGDFYDHLQHGLKVVASSLAYGLSGELHADEPTQRAKPVRVHGLATYDVRAYVVERPGRYFCAPIAALVTAGGRLLIGLAEKLAADRGIDYAYIDTDMIAFTRPQGMDRDHFHALVDEVCAWLQPLSPFAEGDFLRREEYSFAALPDGTVDKGRCEPLYCIVVSAKRYVAYNRLEGGIRIRKFSSHGQGTWQGRQGYSSPPDIPAPWTAVAALANGNGERWSYDLWHDFIRAVEAGKTAYHVPASPWLNLPAFHRVILSTGPLVERYREVAVHVRPFGAFTVLPPLTRTGIMALALQAPDRDTMQWYESLDGVSFYAPYAASVGELGDIRCALTHEVVHLPHTTVREVLTSYFAHPEAKAANPAGVGPLRRRHVTATRRIGISKESDPVADDVANQTDGVIDLRCERMGRYVHDSLSHVLQGHRMADLVDVTGLPRRTIYNVRHGMAPTAKTRQHLETALSLLDGTAPGTFREWRTIDAPWFHKIAGLHPGTIERIRRGELVIADEERKRLVGAMQKWQAESRSAAKPLTRIERRALRRRIIALGKIAYPIDSAGTSGRWPCSGRLQSETGRPIAEVMAATAVLHRCRSHDDFLAVIARGVD